MTGTTFDLLAFAGVLAMGQFSPGPDMVLLTQTSLRHGREAGWWTAAGIATGLTLHSTVAIFAWQAVSGVLPVTRTALHWLAAAYLLWLAWQIWKERHTAAPEGPSDPGSGKWFRRGLLCNLLNPKVVVFLAAVVVPFLGPQRPSWWPIALWAIIVFEGFFLWGLWVAILQHGKIREFHRRAAPAINGGFAFALALLGLVLLFQRD